MKFRKFLATFLVTAMLFTMLAALATINVSAEPFAEITIAAGAQSAIKAVEFDSLDYDWRAGDCGGGKSIRPEERVDTEPGAGAADDFGGNIGWTDHGTWVQWTVNVAADGEYGFEAWCASDNGGNQGLSLLYDDALIGSIDYVEQEGWQEYTLYKFGSITMTAGTHVIKAQWPSVGGFNIAAIITTPYVNGVPMWIPTSYTIGGSKTTIKAVDFDSGKYGKAPADGLKTIRPDEDVNTEAGDNKALEFGGNIGWIAAGDWVQYTVTVQRDGMYKFEAWLASDADPTGGVIVYVDDKEVGTSPNSNKDGWQAYSLYPVGEAAVTAGEHVIKVEFNGGLNITALEVTRTGNIQEATEAPPAAAEDNAADGGDAAAPAEDGADSGGDANNNNSTASDEEDGGNTMIIIIVIIAIVVVVAVVVVIVAMKGKKPKES